MPIDNDRLRRLAGLPQDEDDVTDEERKQNAKDNLEYETKKFIIQVVESANLGEDVAINAFYDSETNEADIVLTDVYGTSLASLSRLVHSVLADDMTLSVSDSRLRLTFQLKKSS